MKKNALIFPIILMICLYIIYEYYRDYKDYKDEDNENEKFDTKTVNRFKSGEILDLDKKVDDNNDFISKKEDIIDPNIYSVYKNVYNTYKTEYQTLPEPDYISEEAVYSPELNSFVCGLNKPIPILKNEKILCIENDSTTVFDCVTGRWVECVNNTQTRINDIPALNGGLSCGPNTRTCSHCILNVTNSKCVLTTGVNTTTVTVVSRAFNGGLCVFQNYTLSNLVGYSINITSKCDVDCIGGWVNEGTCDPHTGLQKQNWNITQTRLNNGAVCSHGSLTNLTNGSSRNIYCAVACSGEWRNSGQCLQSSGKYQQTYYANITGWDGNGNKLTGCDGNTYNSTRELNCSVACAARWVNTGECQEGTGKKQQTFTANITGWDGNGNKLTSCNGTNYGTTQNVNCAVNCNARWVDQIVNGELCQTSSGKKRQLYIPNITGWDANGNKLTRCNNTDYGNIQDIDCNIDCVGDYGPYSECNKETGTQTRTYHISKEQRNQGTPCLKTQGYVETTNCDVNCVGSWSDYGNCTKSTGYKTKTFKITTPQKNNGRHCDYAHNTTSLLACPVECETDNPEWGECDTTTGLRARTKTVLVSSKNTETNQCPTGYNSVGATFREEETCPVDCVGDWEGTCRYGDGSVCPCGDSGWQWWVNTRQAKNGGTCPHRERNIQDNDIVYGCNCPSCPSPSCFTGDTPIEMADGTFKSIKDIKVGDYVMNYNRTGKNRIRMVEVIPEGIFNKIWSPNKSIKPFASLNHPLYLDISDDKLSAPDPFFVLETLPFLLDIIGDQINECKTAVIEDWDQKLYNIYPDNDTSYRVYDYGTISLYTEDSILFRMHELGVTIEEMGEIYAKTVVKQMNYKYIIQGSVILDKITLCLYEPLLNFLLRNKVMYYVWTVENKWINYMITNFINFIGYMYLHLSGKFKKLESLKEKYRKDTYIEEKEDIVETNETNEIKNEKNGCLSKLYKLFF